MTKTLVRSTVLAGVILAGLGVAADSAQTLGEQLASGRLSEAAFQQLIAHTGLSAEEAQALTLDEIVAIKWQND